MASNFYKGAMGGYYQNAPSNPGYGGYGTPAIGHWLSALGVDYKSPLASKPITMAEPLAQFSRNMQQADPGYARQTWFDDPGNLDQVVRGTWSAFNSAATQAGYQPISLPDFIRKAFGGNKQVAQMYSQVWPTAAISSGTDDWLSGMKPAPKR
jgi:hypothetical protein